MASRSESPVAVYQRRKRALLKSQGACPTCQQMLEPGYPYVLCTACRHAKREELAARRQMWEGEGLCNRCGRDLDPPAPPRRRPFKRCATCRAKLYEHLNRHYAELLREEGL